MIKKKTNVVYTDVKGPKKKRKYMRDPDADKKATTFYPDRHKPKEQ